ncbi:hypothetical protein Tco_1473351 [Tanacetum coccineum]
MFQGGLPLYLWPNYVLTAVYLINKLPSFVSAGQSPYFPVYGRNPTLSHLRAYGCLSFATILNNNDKFNSRDVKFYETVFPFKIKQKEGLINTGVTTDLNHRNFFDFEQPNPKSPYDEGRVPSNDDGTYSSSLNEDDDESDATSIEDNAHPEGNPKNLNHSDESEFLNDYVIDIKVKFGLNKVVNYCKLSNKNLCFTTALNKSFEPSRYKDAITDNNWVEAMNNEMEALNRNHT